MRWIPSRTVWVTAHISAILKLLPPRWTRSISGFISNFGCPCCDDKQNKRAGKQDRRLYLRAESPGKILCVYSRGGSFCFSGDPSGSAAIGRKSGTAEKKAGCKKRNIPAGAVSEEGIPAGRG